MGKCLPAWAIWGVGKCVGWAETYRIILHRDEILRQNACGVAQHFDQVVHHFEKFDPKATGWVGNCLRVVRLPGGGARQNFAGKQLMN